MNKNAEYQRKWYNSKSVREKRKLNKARYKAYKDKMKENSKQWAKNNPYRKKAHENNFLVKRNFPEKYDRSTITVDQLEEWLKDRLGKPCNHCGEPSTSISYINLLEEDGEYELHNLEAVCSWCKVMLNKLNRLRFKSMINRIMESIEK